MDEWKGKIKKNHGRRIGKEQRRRDRNRNQGAHVCACVCACARVHGCVFAHVPDFFVAAEQERESKKVSG